ncbi:hypothetical protein DFH06DRAFT_1166860 [Mycena polygramma]|nr:hypothetical protein DFH06DRAFT_1166860 [Mycena polygramma]
MDSSANQCLEANPDISGLGVRIAFYVQTLALVFLAGRSLEEALNSVWTLLGTSFGLTISGLVTAVRHQLPLYQAIILTDLVWLADYAIFMALATYNRHRHYSYTAQYAAILQIYFSSVLVLYVWACAPSLEPDEDAGKTVFVVLFASTSATGAGRIVALVFTCLLIAGYSVVAIPFIRANPPELKKMIDGFVDARDPDPRPPMHSTAPTGAPPGHEDAAQHGSGSVDPQPMAIDPRDSLHNDHDPHPPMHSTAPTGAALGHEDAAQHGSGSVLPGPMTNSSSNPPPSRRLRRDIDPHLMTLALLFGGPYIITLICTELQIHKNRLCTQNSSWEFGQILVLSLTVVPLFVTIAAFRKYGVKQR